jgi:hypothetical protein
LQQTWALPTRFASASASVPAHAAEPGRWPAARHFSTPATAFDVALASIDSVAADTRTVYVRGRGVGTTWLAATDSVSNGTFTLRVTVE